MSSGPSPAALVREVGALESRNPASKLTTWHITADCIILDNTLILGEGLAGAMAAEGRSSPEILPGPLRQHVAGIL